MRPMQGFPVAAAGQATLANWRTSPFNHWAFHHAREIVPSARIAAGGQAWRLDRRPREIGGLQFDDGAGRRHRLEHALAQTHNDGFLVLHRGAIVTERYDHGMRPDDPHILMSVSKSLTALVAGILADQGRLDPEAMVSAYLPEVAGSAYGDATVRHLLDMTAGVDFVEDYEASDGLIIAYREASGWNPPTDPGAPPGDLRGFLLTLDKAGEHGGIFRYTSPNTDLLGWVIERAAGERFADLVARVLWQPLGAEHDAYVLVDRLGAPRTAGGICTTLRDLARVGQTMLQRGVADARAVLPGWWVDDTVTAGDSEAWRQGTFSYLMPRGRYRNKWYQIGDDLDAFCGIGIHGQFLYVAPGNDVVIARFASSSHPFDDEVEKLMLAACDAVARAL